MSNSTPDDQKKLALELALQNKQLLEEKKRQNQVVSALNSRAPVLVFSQPKRAEILMIKGQKKKKSILLKRFQNTLLDQFLEDQQKKIKAENEYDNKKENGSQKPKFLEMHLHQLRGSQPKIH